MCRIKSGACSDQHKRHDRSVVICDVAADAEPASIPRLEVALGFVATAERYAAVAQELAGEMAGFRRQHPLPPLGVGEVDYAYMLAGPGDAGTLTEGIGAGVTVYGDTFLRRQVVVTITYAERSDRADPSLLATYAQLQDTKLVAASFLP